VRHWILAVSLALAWTVGVAVVADALDPIASEPDRLPCVASGREWACRLDVLRLPDGGAEGRERCGCRYPGE